MSEAVMTLRQARERQAHSQESLGQLAQVAEFTIQRIERHHVYPRPSTRRKLAAALGMQPWEILWEAPAQRRAS